MSRRQDTTVIATTVRGDTLILEPLWTLEPLWALEACGAGVSKARANPNWLAPFNGSAMFANFLRGLAKRAGACSSPSITRASIRRVLAPRPASRLAVAGPLAPPRWHIAPIAGPCWPDPCRGKPICSATGPSTTFGIRIASLVAPDTDAD